MAINQKGIAHFLLIFVLLAGIVIAVYLTQFTQVFKPFASNSESVADMTQQLISENNKIKQDSSLSTASKDSSTGSMASLSFRRKAKLEEILKDDPKEFLKQATLANSASDFPPSVSENLEKFTDKSGEFIHLHGDNFETKTSTNQYFLEATEKDGEKREYELFFAVNEPTVTSGSEIKVKAVQLNNDLVVGSAVGGVHEVAGTDLDVISVKSIQPPTAVKVAFILANFQDKPNDKPDTKQEVIDAVLTSDKSVKKFYEEASANKINFSAEVFDYITLPVNSNNCDLQVWEDQARIKAQQEGIDLSQFNYLSLVVSDTSCFGEAAGIAIMGGDFSVVFGPGASVMAHELGHNFGLGHSNLLDCHSKTIDIYPNCEFKEGLGDPYDLMGGGYNLFHGPHDLLLKWLPDSQLQTITSDGTYRIIPLKQNGNGTKLIKIAKKDTNQFYYLDYRQPFGLFDSEFVTSIGGGRYGVTEGAVIRLANDIPEATWLLDMNFNPNGDYEYAFVDGQTFSDPYNGMEIKQLNHDANGVNLDIKFSAPTKPTINASPNSLNGGNPVTVSVRGLINPNILDWVGLYTNSEQDNTKIQDWFYLASCDKTLGTPSSEKTCTYVMPNKIENGPPGYSYYYNFRLFRNNSYELLNVSNNVNVFPNPSLPPSSASPSPTSPVSPSPTIPTPPPPTPKPSETPKPNQKTVFGDFDGDGRADFATFRPSNSLWSINTRAKDLDGNWGANGDIPVIGDYNGDGKMDKAVYRPSSSTWYISNEDPRGTQLGAAGDIPVPGDYNGDKITDKAVYRVASGTWETTAGNIGWSRPNSSAIAVPADYNGDGKTDVAWFSGGTWLIKTSGNSQQAPSTSSINWGAPGDIPVPADYNGDGKAEIAVFRPTAGKWYIYGQDPNGVSWGGNGDIPVPADYNGDGKADITVFRPGNGTWYPYPSGGFSANGVQFGQNGDIPAEKRPSYPGYPF